MSNKRAISLARVAGVTPEYIKQCGNDLEPAFNQGTIGGKRQYTNARRKMPFETVKILEHHELESGRRIWQLFNDAHLERSGVVDPSRVVVDVSFSDHTPASTLDARQKYNTAIKTLPPSLLPIIDDVVIHEYPMNGYCRKHKCHNQAAAVQLKAALEILAKHFGYC